MSFIRKTSLLYMLFICVFALKAQINITENGKALSRIIVVDDSETNLKAANLLKDFVLKISGAELKIKETSKWKEGDIIIGEKTDKAGEDGFQLLSSNGCLHIMSGGDKGAIYGVVTLLEKYLGVQYYAYETYTLSQNPNISIPEINHSETPAFRYRQTFSYGNEDPVYKLWFRLEEPNETFINNMWVHTFDRILPSERFGKEHPEYYSFINGKHRPGNHSQWCLTNPAVFDAAVKQLDSIFKANPGMRTISVSQNDGNHTNCTCDECKKVDEYEGSPSGNIIRFMNKLAERFPDKEFSTLAYLYSMQPPKHTKPLPNVNIMLCDIDCKREVPLTDNASGQEFMRALKGWSEISDNIFVWDYGINFDNIVSPFPNFHIIQKNIQLFKEHNVTMHFSQVNGIKGGDFSEMRAYMIAKLMWNPYQDTDSLMLSFMKGYYGDATPYLYQYHKIMQGALLASHQPLWIYDSPISHKNGMLCLQLIKTYNELFDKAEAAVADNKLYLDHVRLSRLPLIYSELEILRTYPERDMQTVKSKLELFRTISEEFGVKTLNERNNPPAEYYELYKERFLPSEKVNLAAGASVRWILPPSDKYKALGETALTDGLFGGTTFVESWVGWEGKDASFVVDLGSEKEISSIEIDFLHQLGGWILLPKGGTYSVSTNNQTFLPFGSFEFAEDRDPKVKFVRGKVAVDSPVKARYIKVDIKTLGMCPSWHYGVGYPAWFFMDEIMVY